MNRSLVPLLGIPVLALVLLTGCDGRDPADPAPLAPSEPAEASGPRISATLDESVWTSDREPVATDLFLGGALSFRAWGLPGASGAAIATWEFAFDDPEAWQPPASGDSDPTGPQRAPVWDAEAGVHDLYVRATDHADRQTVLRVPLRLFSGPLACPAESRSILVVLDSDPTSLVKQGILPADVDLRGWVERVLAGRDITVHETNGTVAPDLAMLDCASTVIWVHTADVASGDASVLSRWHREGNLPLTRYVRAGGNLLLCGTGPAEAVRWAGDPSGGRFRLPEPIRFGATLQDRQRLPHWMAAVAGIREITATLDLEESRRRPLHVARSVADGYPDLHAAAHPGPDENDCGVAIYDLGIRGRLDAGLETIYVRNDTRAAVGVRRLSTCTDGSVIYLGFHPLLVEEDAAGIALDRALQDLGEGPISRERRPR